jgi:hypothetical protein
LISSFGSTILSSSKAFGRDSLTSSGGSTLFSSSISLTSSGGSTLFSSSISSTSSIS